MKAAGKVALVGLGILAIAAVPAFAMTGFGLFDRAKKLSPEEDKSWQEALAKRGPLPKMMPAPDGSGRMVPVVGVVRGAGNPRGHYG